MSWFTVWLDGVPISLLVMACLTLGLAPFTPPHIVEKLGMLMRSELVRPIDWFDLLFHASPWLLLAAKGVRTISGGAG